MLLLACPTWGLTQKCLESFITSLSVGKSPAGIVLILNTQLNFTTRTNFAIYEYILQCLQYIGSKCQQQAGLTTSNLLFGQQLLQANHYASNVSASFLFHIVLNISFLATRIKYINRFFIHMVFVCVMLRFCSLSHFLLTLLFTLFYVFKHFFLYEI